MKIGIVLAYHNFVNKFILPCLNSIVDYSKCEKFVCVLDNESSHKDNYKVADFCKAHDDFLYVRIDDQHKNGGLTGAWNNGIDLCIQNDCEAIFIMNDDILINESWEYFVSSVISDNTIYGPISNNPGHVWVDNKRIKTQFAKNNQSRNENPIKVGFVNGFCFACTAKTFLNNMYDEKHYFNPDFPFEGNETEFQLRLFNLTPTHDNKQNKKMLGALLAHDRAMVVPRCYVYHYKNKAWKISGGGEYSKEQFV